MRLVLVLFLVSHFNSIKVQLELMAYICIVSITEWGRKNEKENE